MFDDVSNNNSLTGGIKSTALFLLTAPTPSFGKEYRSFLYFNRCCLATIGGHPHNWTAISRECLSLLNDMTQKLVLYQEAAATNGRMYSSYSVEPKRLSSPGDSQS